MLRLPTANSIVLDCSLHIKWFPFHYVSVFNTIIADTRKASWA